MGKNPIIRLLTVIAVCVLAISCTTSPGRSRGSLGDAMGKARDDHEGSRRVPDHPRIPDEEQNPRVVIPEKPEKEPSKGKDVEETDSTEDSFTSDIHYGIRGSTSIYSSGDFGSDWSADIVLSGSVAQTLYPGVFLGIRLVEPVPDSDLDLSVDGNLVFLKAGLECTYLPFPDLRVFSPYITAGLGGFFMFWSFENVLVADTELIDSDIIGGVILFAGIGVYPYRGDRFRISIGLIPEVYLFGSETQEGFYNDYFSAFSSVNARFELLL